MDACNVHVVLNKYPRSSNPYAGTCAVKKVMQVCENTVAHSRPLTIAEGSERLAKLKCVLLNFFCEQLTFTDFSPMR